LTRARCRRAAAAVAGALLLIPVIPAVPAAADDGSCLPDGRCLIVNPVATPDQLRVEELAARVAVSAKVSRARAEVTRDYTAAARKALGPLTPAIRAKVDAAVAELTYASAEEAGSSDPYRPTVLTVDQPPHLWFGRAVPGSRTGGANPDVLTRRIAIDSASDYVISGKIHPLPAAEASFSLLGDVTSDVRTATLPNDRLAIAPDGTFVVTVGPEPAGGRSNHLQMVNGTRQVKVQEVFRDGIRQTPDSLSVQRVSGPVAPPPPSADAVAGDAAAILRRGAKLSLRWLVGALTQPVNRVPAPAVLSAGSILSAWSTTHVAVRRGQALVLTLAGPGARYVGVSIADPWGLTPVDTLLRSVNSGQARPNPDGSYTVVVSPADPGVANWVDSSDVPVGLVTVRWEGLPPAARSHPPALTGTLVDTARLASVLPAGTGAARAGERMLQRLARAIVQAKRTAELIYTPPAPPDGATPPGPVPPGGEGVPAATTACPTGGQNPGGDRLTPQAECAQQQVRARFGFLQGVGGCCGNGSGKGDHPTGHAVDLMLSGNGTTSAWVRAEGDRVVAWLIANQGSLHVKYIGWWEHIWSPGRGWQVECLPTFSSCGLDGPPTVTSMHEDHVHLSVR
jgi:hypothetical protein